MGAIVVVPEPLRSLAFGSIGMSYVPVGSIFGDPIRLMKIINTMNVDIIVSYDGITDHDYVPAGGFTLYDFSSNNLNNVGWFLKSDTQIYVKVTSAPASGGVFLVAYHGLGD